MITGSSAVTTPTRDHPHITLEESGANYEAHQIMLAKGEHKTEAYLKINARGKVPALKIDDRVLTENTAILTYLAKTHPQANLMPKDPLGEVRCISTMAWLSRNRRGYFWLCPSCRYFSCKMARHSGTSCWEPCSHGPSANSCRACSTI